MLTLRTLIVFQSQRSAALPSLSRDSDSVSGSSLKPSLLHPEHRVHREDLGVTVASSRPSQGHAWSAGARSDPGVHSIRGER